MFTSTSVIGTANHLLELPSTLQKTTHFAPLGYVPRAHAQVAESVLGRCSVTSWIYYFERVSSHAAALYPGRPTAPAYATLLHAFAMTRLVLAVSALFFSGVAAYNDRGILKLDNT